MVASAQASCGARRSIAQENDNGRSKLPSRRCRAPAKLQLRRNWSSTLECEFADFTIEGFIASYPVTNPEAKLALRNGVILTVA